MGVTVAGVGGPRVVGELVLRRHGRRQGGLAEQAGDRQSQLGTAAGRPVRRRGRRTGRAPLQTQQSGRVSLLHLPQTLGSGRREGQTDVDQCRFFNFGRQKDFGQIQNTLCCYCCCFLSMVALNKNRRNEAELSGGVLGVI